MIKIKCIECKKEADELRQIVEDTDLFICEDCYDTVHTGVLNILNYMEDKFK